MIETDQQKNKIIDRDLVYNILSAPESQGFPEYHICQVESANDSF